MIIFNSGDYMKENIKKILIGLKKASMFYVGLSITFLLILGVGLGIYIGEYIYSDTSNSASKACTFNNDYELGEDLEEFVSVYSSIVNDYYKEVEKDKFIEGAIDGMLNSLDDPYTSYMDSQETIDFNLRMQGDYEGIGSYIGVNDAGEVIISQPFSDSPAEKAGLLPMDVILEVDGVNVEGKTTEIVASFIRGTSGTDVVLKLRRGEEVITKTVTRDSIEIHSVTSRVIAEGDNKIGYISLELFSDNSYEDFQSNLLELETAGVDSLIIDVRNNSGGYLGEVTRMLSLFLDTNEIIYQLENNTTNEKIYSLNNATRDYEVIVLVNELSASASEILAIGLQEAYSAKLIGMTTFGKGLVQTPEYLETGGMIKYSNEKWLSPLGNWIHEIGIVPDYEIELSDEYLSNPTDATDSQLQKAIELLK